MERVIQAAAPGGVHERTLVMIFGDHGQTLTGDHGGGSREELDSALVAINAGAVARARVAHDDAHRSNDKAAHIAAAEADECKASAGSATSTAHSAAQCASAERGKASAGAEKALKAAELAEVPQLDFAASLSVLLGLPIPAENVGALVCSVVHRLLFLALFLIHKWSSMSSSSRNAVAVPDTTM